MELLGFSASVCGNDESSLIGKMTKMRSGKTAIMTGIALLIAVASSRGQSLNLSGATLEGELTGQTLFNSGTGANDGIVSTWVISDSSIDSQGYIFIYQLENVGPDDVTGVNFNNFSPSQYLGSESYSNAYNGSLSGALSPTITANPNFTFDTITGGGAATFNGDLGMGATSWLMAIDTDVSAFNNGYALAQDDFQANGDVLAPNYAVYPVPEPSSLSLTLLAGFFFLCGFLKYGFGAGLKR
jgi:hypothetical protein